MSLGKMGNHARLHSFDYGMRIETDLRRTPHSLSSIRSAPKKKTKTKTKWIFYVVISQRPNARGISCFAVSHQE